MQRRLVITILWLSLLSFIPGIPFFLKITCALVQFFYVPGFVFLFFFWDRRSPALDDLFIPPLISPIVLSLFTACAFAFTHSLGSSVVISMIVLYCLLSVAIIRERRSLPPEDMENIPLSTVLIPFLFCASVSVFYLLNPCLMVQSDAMYHAPYVNEIIDHGIPPKEPRLIDAPLRYPWFYHLFVGGLVERTGLTIFPALSLTNAMTALTFPYLIGRIAARYTRSRIHLLSAQAVAVAGLAAASWILYFLYFLRAFTGDVRGHEEIVRILSQIDLNSYRVIFFLTPPFAMVTNPILYKFVNMSPFNYAIDLVLLCLLLALSTDLQKSAPLKTTFTVGFIMIGTFLVHIVTGITLMFTVVGAGVFLLLGQLLRRGEKPPCFQTLVLPPLALLVGAICLPYFRSLTGAEGERIIIRDYLHLRIENLVTVIAPMIGLFFIIKPLLKYLFRVNRVEHNILSAWLIALFMIVMGINLPQGNEYKFALLFLIVLATPATIVLVDWVVSLRGSRRACALAWIVVLFLVPTFLIARGLLLTVPESDAVRDVCMQSRDRMQLYEWVRTRTSNNSVVMEREALTLASLFAHRHTFPYPLRAVEVMGYKHDMVVQDNAVHDDVFSEKPIPSASIRYLRNLGREICIVLWAEDLRAYPHLEEKLHALGPSFKKVYENSAGMIYCFNGSSSR